MALLSLEDATSHLRMVLTTDGNSPATVTDIRYPDLVNKMAMAESMVWDYLEMEEADLSASGVSTNWPNVIKAAMLIILSSLWDDHEGTGTGDYFKEDGAVHRLLKRIRNPAIA